MRSIKVMVTALLAASNAMAAETPPESALPNIERLVAQAQDQAERARAEAERAAVGAERARSKHESRRAPTDEEELALAAMEGLMSQPPERALPIIKKVMAGSQTTLVKQRALFILSQLDAPEAQQILLQTARSADETLRQEAIRGIGIGGNSQSLTALRDIYNNGDEAVKRQVLEAWLIAGRKEDVYQAAVNAKSDTEANQAIRMLSAMGAVDELRKLGDQPKARSGLVEAYAISGDLESLRKIAQGNGDVSVRSEAVRQIGIIRNDAARTALREIYSSSANAEIKDAALQGMLIARDERGVLALYRAAKTTDEKRALLRTLTLIGGDAALEAIDATLEERK